MRRIHMPIDPHSAPTRLLYLKSESYETFFRDNNILTRMGQGYIFFQNIVVDCFLTVYKGV